MDPLNQWQGLLSSPFQRQPRETAFKAAKGTPFESLFLRYRNDRFIRVITKLTKMLVKIVFTHMCGMTMFKARKCMKNDYKGQR